MKTLPKFYVIKRDKNNPLWKKYIDWLNGTYKASWCGELYNYYGYNNGYHLTGTAGYYDINYFENNPKLITLEQWDEAVNKTETMEQRKIIGYKAPFDLFDGEIKKGTIYEKRGSFQMYHPPHELDRNMSCGIPDEIVETWEPVYEEEKLEIRSYHNFGEKKSALYFKGKLTQEIIDKIKEVI